MKNRAGDITSVVWLVAGFAFLYLPIVTLITLSFNESPLVTTWTGFSFKWYGELVKDVPIIEGFVLSIKIALMTATASVVLGTFAAVAITKFKRFPGRTLLTGMVNSPLVMPEVIIGLSLLLMLVSVQRATGFPDRGMLTIWLGHTLLGMAYATVVVTSRLQEMNPQLEEAGLDLGAKPWQVFWQVVFPAIRPAMLTGLALSFARAVGEFGSVVIISGNIPLSTLTGPVLIFQRLEEYNTVGATGIAVVMLIASLITLVAINLLQARGHDHG